jgi:hypothetical protein
MSRSNPTQNARNPSTRWFEWHGSKGQINYWDKEAKQRVFLNLPFTFLLLDELATVRGFHQASNSGVFANEVRDTRQETLLVRAFEGGEIASGLYANIRDRVKAHGGYFQASCYVAYKDGDAPDRCPFSVWNPRTANNSDPVALEIGIHAGEEARHAGVL